MNDLIEQRANKEKALDAISEKATTEGRDLTDDEVKLYKATEVEIKSLTEKIEVQESIVARAKIKGQKAPALIDVKPDSPEELMKKFSWSKLVCGIVGRANNIEGAELELVQEGAHEFKSLAGVSPLGMHQLPSFFVKATRALNITTGADGGDLVDTQLRGMIPALSPSLVLEKAGAEMLTGLTANVDFTRNSSRASAAWEGENDPNAATDPQFDLISLRPNRIGAKTEIGSQFALQQNFASDSFIQKSIETAIAEEVDKAGMNGSGSGNVPLGIKNVAGIGDVAIGTDGGSLTWVKVVEFLKAHTSSNAPRNRLSWVTTPEVLAHLMTIDKAAGAAQFILPAPGDKLIGRQILDTTLAPSGLTKGINNDCHAMFYGDFSELLIGQWGGLDVIVDPFTLADTAQFRIVVNTWWDIAVKHAASFTACQDIRPIF